VTSSGNNVRMKTDSKYFQLAISSGGEATHPREGDGIGGAA
jgi:hypothetical protein